MASPSVNSKRMRIWHRYLGFFLAGIMAVYAISGIILIFRDTDFLKQVKQYNRVVDKNMTEDALGRETGVRNLKFTSDSASLKLFKTGHYNPVTGQVKYTTKNLPPAIEKLTQLHKASTKKPLFFLNIFFGASLLFFVLSSFWMFMPSTSIFKKGLYFTLAGIILTLILLFL